MKFWTDNIAETADYCKKNFTEDTEMVMDRANELCENIFLFSDHWEMERTHEPVKFEDKIIWQSYPKDDEEWMFAMNRHTGFVNLGKAYQFTKDEKYALCYKRLLLDWIEHVPLTEDSKKYTWRAIEVGIRSELWLRAKALFQDSRVMDENFIKKMEISLLIHGQRLVDTHEDFHRLSNWGVIQDHGLFLLGIYFKNDEWIKPALTRLDEKFLIQVMQDGTYWEQSPMYHCEVLHCALNIVSIARKFHIELSSDFEKRSYALCLSIAKMLTPLGRLICQSDTDDADARVFVAKGALLFSDSYLKFIAKGQLYSENLWDFGMSCIEDYAKTQELAPKETSTYLPDSGNYMLRSDLSELATYLHMHCGCLGSAHGHIDLLHIDVVHRGEEILIDSGRYTYVNKQIRYDLKQLAAHNTTRVDGKDFNECLDSWTYSHLAVPIKGECKLGEKFDFISGGHLGYQDKGVFTQRKILFIKPDIFIVFDRFYTSGEHSYEQYFHLGEGDLSTKDNTAFWEGKKTSSSFHFIGDVSVKQSRKPYAKDYNKLQEGDVLKVMKSAKGDCGFATVICLGCTDTIVESIPVTNKDESVVYNENIVQAFRIVKDTEEITVMVFHQDQVSISYANGHSGYGMVQVFTNDFKGTVAW